MEYWKRWGCGRERCEWTKNVGKKEESLKKENNHIVNVDAIDYKSLLQDDNNVNNFVTTYLPSPLRIGVLHTGRRTRKWGRKDRYTKWNVLLSQVSTPFLYVCSRKNFVFLFGALINLTVRVDTYFHPIRMTSYSSRTIFQAAPNWGKAAKHPSCSEAFELDRRLTVRSPFSRSFTKPL